MEGLSYWISSRFSGVAPQFLARKARSEVRELYLNTAILELASAIVIFFEPIYLYRLGFSIAEIIIFYLCAYGVYFVIMPLGGKFAKRYGFEHSIVLSSPLLILYYLSLVLTQYHVLFLVPAALFLALQKTFYWPGYHGDFAHYGQDFGQGREISTGTAIISLVTIVGPLIGGALMYFFNFTVLFIVVGVLIALSNVPLIITPERFAPEPFSYKEAYRRLFRSYNRRRFFAYLGFGEEFIALTLWPIFIIIMLDNAFVAGGVVAAATFITSLIVLYVGFLTDKRKAGTVLRFTTIVYSLVWLMRLLTRGIAGIFLVDTFARVSRGALSVPITAFTYASARQWGVVKNVIFFEMALVLGKILTMIAVLIMVILVPPSYVWASIFVLGAALSLFYTLLK